VIDFTFCFEMGNFIALELKIQFASLPNGGQLVMFKEVATMLLNDAKPVFLKVLNQC
jgi:hypothetical protein